MSEHSNRPFDESLFLPHIDEDTGDLILSISTDDSDEDDNLDMPDELPILPIRNTVLFPGVVIPITVGRQKSIALIREAYKANRIIGVVAQRHSHADDPAQDELYSVGTVAKLMKMIVLPDGNTTVIIQGRSRFKMREVVRVEPYMVAQYDLLEDNFPDESHEEMGALSQSLKDTAAEILTLNPDIPKEAEEALENIDNPRFLTHFLSSNVSAEVGDKQRLLEENDGLRRAKKLLEYMLRDVKMLELKHEIQKKVNSDIDQQQRDYYLRQQMRILQDELGEDTPERELEELRAKGMEKNWPKEVLQHFNKELDKLSRMNPGAAEYPVSMNYVELMVELPWGEYTEDNFDLKRAQKILDEEHYGLEKVKDRILEYLAVLKLKQDMKSPILCLYGPPGVGKTSLGKSIAKALDRKYVRMSLGGVHDEAEVRGHRKTYIGAMPGRVIQNIKKAKSGNPVFVLDEIDKVQSDFRGDPSSALLEVLDPEQNTAFQDNYLEVDYDLSKVLFVATANSLDTIQPALRDRMEIIEITGYTLEEKVEIAKRHLVPKQNKEHGLAEKQLQFPKKVLSVIIDGYTRESGVRNLERQIGKVVRRVAKAIAMEEAWEEKVTEVFVREVLGAAIFDKEAYQDNRTAGVVTGLAWTQVGGEILFIESSLSRGRGKLTLSGQLGDVMKESAMTALSYLRSHSEQLGIHHNVFQNYDLHVHIPAGAVPKDGPSAGIAMLTSLASVYTQRKVKARLAMTGEITLRGKVLPVGGIKEKILAAKRAGVKDIILCERNRKDIEEIDDRYITGLTIHYVDRVEDVLKLALLKDKVTNPLQFITEEPEAKPVG
ncbi:MAG TPA: endopeptidase La [Cytophagales bacterium]|nr:endopeptidase La [Cytophagales bacterium]HAA19762.1 endopeptidase La [Cytophagales bacterium]HAP58337.1 endopeptidase La [Cytophagales bacterium]